MSVVVLIDEGCYWFFWAFSLFSSSLFFQRWRIYANTGFTPAHKMKFLDHSGLSSTFPNRKAIPSSKSATPHRIVGAPQTQKNSRLTLKNGNEERRSNACSRQFGFRFIRFPSVQFGPSLIVLFWTSASSTENIRQGRIAGNKTICVADLSLCQRSPAQF